MVVAAAAYSVLLAKDAESLYANYVDTGLQSEGALVRLLMNAAPAAVLLTLRSRFQFDEIEKRLGMLLSLTAGAVGSLLRHLRFDGTGSMAFI